MRQKLKIVLSWLVAALGCFAGLFALARFGMWWLPLGDGNPGWLLYWLTFAGFGLFGLGFLAGSIVAPRDPKHAGIIFLVFLPIAAFCLAYPESGFLVWHADGSGWFETPLPLTAIGLTVLFFIPFVLPLFTLHHKKRAAIVFAVAVLAVVPVFIHSRWTTVLVPHLLGYSVPLLLFGAFWLGTNKLGWPSLLPPRPRGPARRIASIVVTCIVVLSLDIAMTLGLAALGSSLFSGDCSGKSPITQPESPKHAVFTARVLFVGRSLEALTQGAGLRSMGVHDRPVGDWAIGVVRERSWGVPSRWPHLVLMTDYIYWKGETYFIDGLRESGLITRILPIVGARIGCSRSRPVQGAIVDLRVLREGPPGGDTRLIGYVKRPEVLTGVFGPPTVPSFAVGATIDVTGAAGTKTITTDKTGIYQLDGLQPGDYNLQLAAPDNQVVGLWDKEGSPAKVHIGTKGLVEHNFDLFWNGRIEGQAKDDFRKPAHVGVLLLSMDGSRLPGYVKDFLATDPDGSYQFKKIPPGRYTVVVNPDGPSDGFPYDIRYYRSALQSQDAQVLDLGAGQQIRAIDFTVPHLKERTVRVRVTWSNGSVAAGAHICVAYEHTKEYGSAQIANGIRDTDQNGLAVIHVYGNSAVRVFANLFVDDAKWNHASTYYSHPVESEASKLPDEIDLVMTSPKL